MFKRDIKSMLPVELEEYFAHIGDEQYRAKQVFGWLHKGVSSFKEMTNLSASLRSRLNDDFIITAPSLEEKHVSNIDSTTKYLWRLSDNTAIESVLMQYEYGCSVCISTQVGCKMGCLFCASGIGGLERNLTASEMLDQVLYTEADAGKRISNIVLMGIGEPLDNFENVIRFLEIITSPLGINIGARHLTLSTVGIIENIDKLADYGIQLTLAISLHAPDDATRKRLIPVCEKYRIDELLAAGKRYFAKTGRRVSYEYALIEGINDTAQHATLLSDILKSTNSHLNIIQLNHILGNDLLPSSQERVDVFIEVLRQNGVNYTVRRSLGSDIAASCGMLRQRR